LAETGPVEETQLTCSFDGTRVASEAGRGKEGIDLIVGGDVEVVQIETVADPIDLRHSGRGQAAVVLM
jgi:hypothetical protein